MPATSVVGGRHDPVPGARICVTVAAAGGWNLSVDQDGKRRTEHYDDWHKVERRRAVLECAAVSRPEHAAR